MTHPHAFARALRNAVLICAPFWAALALIANLGGHHG